MLYAIRQIFLKGGDIKDAINYIFKTTGKMPTKSEGMKIINVYQDVQKHSGKIIQFPKDRITPFHISRPGEASPLLKDSPEAIAKIKAENKAAAERLRKKKEAEELFTDERPPKDPEFASGGIARVGYLKGGKVWKDFIEKLFIKTSNDIRQGKGKWANLTQDQWIKQHDDLTKMIKKWEWGGKKGLPQGAEQFIGMNDLQVTRAIKDATKKVEDEKLMQTAYDEIKGGSGFSGDYKYDADILAEEYAKQHGKVYADLPEDQISIYYNPALKRVSQDMLKRIEAKKALKDVEQKVELQMFDTKGKTPHAEGGIAGELHLNEGGRVSFVKGGKVSSGLANILGV